MIWLLANRNFMIFAVCWAFAGIAFFAGYRLCTLQYEAAQKAAIEKRLEKTNEGVKKIVDFNQKWDAAHGKDDCTDKPISDAMRLLLK